MTCTKKEIIDNLRAKGFKQIVIFDKEGFRTFYEIGDIIEEFG